MMITPAWLGRYDFGYGNGVEEVLFTPANAYRSWLFWLLIGIYVLPYIKFWIEHCCCGKGSRTMRCVRCCTSIFRLDASQTERVIDVRIQ